MPKYIKFDNKILEVAVIDNDGDLLLCIDEQNLIHPTPRHLVFESYDAAANSVEKDLADWWKLRFLA